MSILCGRPCDQLIDDADVLAHMLVHLNRLETRMSEVVTDQQHLAQDVAALTTAFGEAVAELKAQIGGGTPAEALDFTGLDALVASVQAEAAADVPPAPPVDTTPPPADDTSVPETTDTADPATTDVGQPTDATATSTTASPGFTVTS